MKNILVVCGQPDIDAPLRKSLGHLVNSCEIRVTPNGFQAFDELGLDTFDLIVIDSEITGIDSLELVESVDYIDPGIPVILMLHEAHQVLWGPSRTLRVNPIVRPFKPVTFIRLVDTLLHEHLERYRDLAETLKSILDSLRQEAQATVTFLTDGSGSTLVASGELDDNLLRPLGAIVAGQVTGNTRPEDLPDLQSSLLAQTALETDHKLYVTIALENLYLALILPTNAAQPAVTEIWHWLDLKTRDVALAFFENITFMASRTADEEDWPSNGVGLSKDPDHDHVEIPLKLTSAVPVVESHPAPDETAEPSINWQIIPDTSNLVDRLHDFCQID
jgi:DNA-binding NarL/FixJ family response regulator